jgi:DNA-directed RNA polymerase subunit RPC12/RpoP
MTSVAEIRCPDCNSVHEVQKVGVGTYRCRECGTEFGVEDVQPE